MADKAASADAGLTADNGSRRLFVAAILTGSFLLFLVQPMVARLALPRLGGAPNVWNSAMLVYQALLLGGYAYAHFLSRWTVRRQAMVHLILLLLAGLTLPITLARLAPPAPGWEALWVPALLALTIGPVFFLVSAQAPLMQRWFAAGRSAGDPYALYAASNIGSFAGLICYPILFEPNLTLKAQSWLWSAGYGVLVLFVGAVAWTRREAQQVSPASMSAVAEPMGARRILLWLVLAAVPSGLMLSTTTHLTTDIFAMPLLWVIPLGLYLLSFVPAFSEDRALAATITRYAPLVLLLAGGMAMMSGGNGNLSGAVVAVVMMFIVSVALHARLYASRPDPAQLTFFYLIMSAGGVLGGIFTALVAPLTFDWVWEHPLLVLAAAALIPLGQNPARVRNLYATERRRLMIATAALVLSIAAMVTMVRAEAGEHALLFLAGMAVIILCGLAVQFVRWAFVLVLGLLMLGNGGLITMTISANHARERSYFGIYTVRDFTDPPVRILNHGTTMHGMQFIDPARRLEPTSYYGPSSGVGIALSNADSLIGDHARVGVVGLGTGTLACYRKPGQSFTFFEIDPTILKYSQRRDFTFLSDCAPRAKVVIGDARLELAAIPANSYDILVIDAFSSDAIPLHLLTKEAFAVYERVVSANGIIMVHISNHYINLRPVLSAAAHEMGWSAALRADRPAPNDATKPSNWVALTRRTTQLAALEAKDPAAPWVALDKPAPQAWTDDYASTIPYVEWHNILGF